jgi:effector-binding domain-containing protein
MLWKKKVSHEKGEQAMSYAISMKTLLPQATASIYVSITAAEIDQTIGQIFGEILNYMAELRIQPAGPPFSRFFEFWPEHVTMEAGFPVSQPVVRPGRIIAGELPGGEVATTWHAGSYETLGQAYTALQSWIKDKGRESGGSPWESYWTDPGTVPNPSEWRTEVIWPLK